MTKKTEKSLASILLFLLISLSFFFPISPIIKTAIFPLPSIIQTAVAITTPKSRFKYDLSLLGNNSEKREEVVYAETKQNLENKNILSLESELEEDTAEGEKPTFVVVDGNLGNGVFDDAKFEVDVENSFTVDNGNDGYVEVSGRWLSNNSDCTRNKSVDSDGNYSKNGVNAQVDWNFQVPMNGDYEIYIHWLYLKKQATDARYSLSNKDNVLATHKVNQAIEEGYECESSGWGLLADDDSSQNKFNLLANTNYKVSLTQDTNSGDLYADAIKVVLDKEDSPTTPTQTGYNVDDGDSYAQPRDPNELACTGDATNINGISVHWSDVSTGNDDLDKYLNYQRQYSRNEDNWLGSEIYSNPYTSYQSFKDGEGEYFSRVRAFYDLNGNDSFEAGEPVSNWSNICSVTYDITPPVKPKWISPDNKTYTRQSENIIFDWEDVADAKGYNYEIYFVEGNITLNYDPCGLLLEGQVPNTQVGVGGTCINTKAVQLPHDGETLRKVKAVDWAGNEGEWSEEYSLVRDTIAPKSYVNDATTQDITNNLTFDVYFEVEDDRSGVKSIELFYRKDQGSWQSYGTFTSSPISFTASEGEGVYDFYTLAEDRADDLTADNMADGSEGDNDQGNVETKQASVEATVEVNRAD